MSDHCVRCLACHSLDVNAYVDGTARCENCGAFVTPADDPSVNGRGEEDLLIFPLLVWSWAPCQTCGSAETGGPDDTDCRECGAELLRIKRRACADGFPIDASPGSATETEMPREYHVGDRGVCVGGRGVRLVAGGPFTLLQIVAIRPNGDLDVAGTGDGITWEGVPRHAFLHLG